MTDRLKKAKQLLDKWFDRGLSSDFLEARNLILKEEQKIITRMNKKVDGQEKIPQGFIRNADKNNKRGGGNSAPPSVSL